MSQGNNTSILLCLSRESRAQNAILTFEDRYYTQTTHTILCSIFFIIGFVGNVTSLSIFCNKKMTSPATILLKGLAIAELLQLVALSPSVWSYYFPSEVQRDSLAWTIFSFFSVYYLATVFRGCVIWFLIAHAYWRYKTLSNPLQNRLQVLFSRIKKTFYAVWIINFLVWTEIFLTNKITSEYVPIGEDGEITEDTSVVNNTWIYYVTFRAAHTIHGQLIMFILLIALPKGTLVMLIVFIVLSYTVIRTSKDRSQVPTSQMDEDEIRLNDMIWANLAVFLMYFLPEIPAVVTGLLTVVIGNDDYALCYQRTRFLEFFALINSCFSPVCYFIISNRYRQIVRAMLKDMRTMLSKQI